jgi:rhomboid protease GluP
MTSTDRPVLPGPPDVPEVVVAIAPPAPPLLTLAILAVLVAVFAGEIVYGIGRASDLLQPTIATLVAFGGLSKDLVLNSGEWYRLFSAPFLHANAAHLGMNAFALFIAGRTMERLIGRAWFGAVYAVGALAGSALSLELNPPSVIGVGASGAIMGLFAAELVISMHFPAGPVRSALRSNAIYVLIPSLLPLATAVQAHGKVDYAAHAGGAIGGAAMGLIMLAVWPRSEPRPGLRPIAALIGLAGLVSLVYPTTSVLRGYEAATFITQLIPDDQYPKTGAEMRSRTPQLIAQYPRDPRPHFTKAAQLLDARDFAGAEREARAGLADENLWRTLLSPQVSHGLRVFLAMAISADRPEQAIETARPVCAALKDGPLRKMLDERRLCPR